MNIDPTKLDATSLIFLMAFTIIVKIVWDWLPKRTNQQPDKKRKHEHVDVCPFHESVSDTVKGLENTVMFVKTRYVDRDEFKELDRNFSVKIDEIKKGQDQISRVIADIRVDIAGLASKEKKSI